MPTPHILVIDDDEAVLQYIQKTLGDHYTITTFLEPLAGIRSAQTTQPHLVMCDIDMPQMDGGAVCRALAEDAQTSHIPFVYLTGMVSPSEVRELGGVVGGRPGISKRAGLVEWLACIEEQLHRST